MAVRSSSLAMRHHPDTRGQAHTSSQVVRRLGYVPALDGLRGIAIALVVGRHAFLTPVGGGFGVDVFFVLSGFLITTLLLEERELRGRVSLRRFYVRRARRLVPALVVMLATYLVVEAFAGHLSRAAVRVAAGGFYTANVFQAFWPHVLGRSPISPLWSLAQEEQFYFVAPIVLLVLIRRGPRTVQRVLLGLIALVVIERFVLTAIEGETQRIYAGPDTHSDGLMVGMLLAVSLRIAASGPAAKRLDRTLGPVAAGGLALAVSALWAPWGYEAPFVNLCAAGLVCCAVAQPRSLTSRLLAARPLVALGRISYSLYLWNAMILIWLHGDAAAGQASLAHYNLGAAAADVVLATLIAAASYRFVEQPFRRRRNRSIQPPQLQPEASLAPG